MPPVSEKQRRFMRAAEHNPGMRKRVGVSKTVAHKYNASDSGGKLPMRKKKKNRRRMKRKSREFGGPKGKPYWVGQGGDHSSLA